jgi:hypothetical protein
MRVLPAIICSALVPVTAAAAPARAGPLQPAAFAFALETIVTGRRPATFYTEPAIYPDGTCRRERRAVSPNPKAGGPPRVIAVEVALAPHCRLPKEGLFANVYSPRGMDEAIAALRRFEAIRAAADAPEALPFELSCRIAAEPDVACRGEARATLAALPIDKILIVDPDGESGWKLAVMPSGPGKPYWDVRWSEDGQRKVTRVNLSWQIPAPF